MTGAPLGSVQTATPDLWLPEWRPPGGSFIIIVRDAEGVDVPLKERDEDFFLDHHIWSGVRLRGDDRDSVLHVAEVSVPDRRPEGVEQRQRAAQPDVDVVDRLPQLLDVDSLDDRLLGDDDRVGPLKRRQPVPCPDVVDLSPQARQVASHDDVATGRGRVDRPAVLKRLDCSGEAASAGKENSARRADDGG